MTESHDGSAIEIAEEIRLSIIIPAKNAEKTLQRLFVSLPRGPHIEWILVDDGSSDSTLRRFEEVQDRVPNVQVLATEAMGSGAARNAGLDIAQGRVVAFCDADDVVIGPSLLTIAEVADVGSYDVVVAASRHLGGDDNCYLRVPVFRPWSQERFNLALAVVFATPWAKLYSRRFLVQAGVRFPAGSAAEDVVFAAEVMLRATNVCTVPVVVYEQHAGGEGSLTGRTGHYISALAALRGCRVGAHAGPPSSGALRVAVTLAGCMHALRQSISWGLSKEAARAAAAVLRETRPRDWMKGILILRDASQLRRIEEC